MDESRLTDFQRKCELVLSCELASLGHVLQNRQLGEITNTFFDHADEIYINYEIPKSNIEVWIYEDGAMIRGENVDERFERPDFDDEEKLIRVFVDSVKTKISSVCKRE